jgi:hypothetical protein
MCTYMFQPNLTILMRCVTFSLEDGEDRSKYVGTNFSMLYCLYTILPTMIYFTNCFGIIKNYVSCLRFLNV